VIRRDRHRPVEGADTVLILTTKAKAAIRSLAEQERIPQGSGLRIALAEDDEDVLELTLDSTPHPGDDILNKGGVWVFLESRAAQVLTEQVLDIRDPGSTTDFYFISQRS
jgi:Fe-S cluster assembly iron-binding protein IscA